MFQDGRLETLASGEVTVKGEFLWGSNFTFLVEVHGSEGSLPAVYKPVRGEQPLWDFPPASLAHREAAAYIVSEALGWHFVPPTVYRRAAPFGPGSIQLYVDHDPEFHYFIFSEEQKQSLRPVVLFDLLINNADRKGSHVLFDPDGKIWLIDHGLCFHEEAKLRTVIWDFVGEPIPDNLLVDLRNFLHLLDDLSAEENLAKLILREISTAELRAMAKRGKRLVEIGRFPSPDPDRRPFPWPEI